MKKLNMKKQEEEQKKFFCKQIETYSKIAHQTIFTKEFFYILSHHKSQ